ncbi:hypothetical protein ABB37_00075 [Leptomonas pyrrhocoris]|uniref:SUI1 domain-containing protein n=1 Tax=Leptomonas pyrrhocoris TaxID=157538 RepID=A0A0N0DZV1_LEPPY|nr:hypothetical protein ABB37_00075 [Leptomonas pyrrhocoris]XP_015664135.1 hypothetical protein ABB37_00075 [Leptomonas pyrrhocoris]XP_015664136.1 hypothetical protein ABB37_00075 [Leptomonas pyrrhocoris]KPA85695.1 hypothetical protein ABB37_00075 [Leptomonas pyrrhocoris]KPA85696.1 hypothetical protein ABB37_00075 [Leptomonas pyrrhocoris]KPA85697.1 hypothetical protein ABB37_00075 [Leptomonas pyrrhocoris]|eukprot:XP_015664134.1 hypothetical protein ABB37_00075 [Leptomonas pyrrhocoris]
MFGRQCFAKETHSVGKNKVKSLRADVLEVIGKENHDLFDLIVGKKDAVTESKYQCGLGASAFVYSVNEAPCFISVDRFSKDEQGCIAQDRCPGYSVIPTVFFFLRLRQLLAEKKERWSHLVGEVGVAVTCFGPTSRFLLSGAHLMMPGIVKVHAKLPLAAGQVALVFTDGVDAPYAVGFVTSNLVSQNVSGVGVYIIQCLRDKLWAEYESRPLSKHSLSSNALLVPVEFGEKEVVGESTDAPQAEATVEVRGDNDTAADSSTNPTNVKGVFGEPALFEEEDSVLTFCLCEAVKQLSPSMLPLPLQQFTNFVVQSFPRDGVHAAHIQFKDTKYKHALPFFQKFPELLTIAEVTPGVHSVLSVNKSAPVMREHVAKYKTFLETDHREAREKEEHDLLAKQLESGTAVLRQSVVSAGVFYTASRDLDEDLIRVLLLGDELNIPEDVRFQTLEQVMADRVPKYEPTPIDASVFDELYTRKVLVDNLKKYIRAHALLVVNAAQKNSLPKVKIDGVLSKMFSSHAYAPELSLNRVENEMLNLFRIKHEIIVRTAVEGSSPASDCSISKRVLRPGSLPTIHLWSQKVKGNFFVTIVRNLESFGFDLNFLSQRWKKQFASSCSVVDPATRMEKLKSGTKIALEIHLQGELTKKVKDALLSEANLPPSVLVERKI